MLCFSVNNDYNVRGHAASSVHGLRQLHLLVAERVIHPIQLRLAPNVVWSQSLLVSAHSGGVDPPLVE